MEQAPVIYDAPETGSTLEDISEVDLWEIIVTSISVTNELVALRQTAHHKSPVLRVVTQNFGGTNGGSAAVAAGLLSGIFQAHSPDILYVQEPRWVQSTLIDRIGARGWSYWASGVKPGAPNKKSGIIVNHHRVQVLEQFFSTSAIGLCEYQGRVDAIFDRVTFLKASVEGRLTLLVSVHGPHKAASARKEQFMQDFVNIINHLRASISDIAAVSIGGDFNSDLSLDNIALDPSLVLVSPDVDLTDGHPTRIDGTDRPIDYLLHGRPLPSYHLNVKRTRFFWLLKPSERDDLLARLNITDPEQFRFSLDHDTVSGHLVYDDPPQPSPSAGAQAQSSLSPTSNKSTSSGQDSMNTITDLTMTMSLAVPARSPTTTSTKNSDAGKMPAVDGQFGGSVSVDPYWDEFQMELAIRNSQESADQARGRMELARQLVRIDRTLPVVSKDRKLVYHHRRPDYDKCRQIMKADGKNTYKLESSKTLNYRLKAEPDFSAAVDKAAAHMRTVDIDVLFTKFYLCRDCFGHSLWRILLARRSELLHGRL